MSLPLPPQSDKSDTKKSQSARTMPSDHGQTEKSGENCHARIAPHSSQGALKKRSAFEDLTNASESQSSQSNKEFLKDVPKNMNWNTSVLELAKNNEMNVKRCKLEPSPALISTTTMVSSEEKPLSMAICTISKTPMSEELSLSKKPLDLKGELTTEETTLVKKSLSSKTYISLGEVPLLEKPPSWLEKTDHGEESVSDSMTFGKKHETEEAAMSKNTLSLDKISIYQGKQSYRDEKLALQDISVEQDSVFIEPMIFRKKPKIEETCPTKMLSSLKKKMYCTEMVSICQEPPPIIGKDKDPFFMEPVSFREKSSTEKAILTKPSLSLKRTEVTQEKMVHLDKSVSEEKLLFKEKLTTEGEFLLQDPSALKKHTTLQKVSLLKKPLVFQKETTTKEESYIMEPLTLEKKPTTEKDILQESLLLSAKPTDEDESLFWKALALRKIDSKVDSLKEPLNLQEKTSSKEESLCEKLLDLKEELSAEVATNTERQLSVQKTLTSQEKREVLQENIISEGESHINQPLILQEEPSSEKKVLFKVPFVFQEEPAISMAFSLEETTTLNEKPTTGKVVSFKDTMTLAKNTTYKSDSSLKVFLIQQNETSLHVPSTASQPGTSKCSTTTMSSVGKFSTASMSSAGESSSNMFFSSQGEKSQQEMTPLEDIDMEDNYNPLINTVYAKDIFGYMKEREEKFIIRKYMMSQIDINSDMRAILVDWLVEVQITFEVSHETLYLAVKLVDHYLMKAVCRKSKLQLLGSVAFMIAAKFEEHTPPCLNDFLYICNDTYQRGEMLSMEIKILKILDFDINIPTAYHFLRRYASCIRVSMQTLTLSRFICEMTLQEYDYVQEKASKLAAGCLLLALHMKRLGHWVPALELYSGYKTSDLRLLVRHLNILLIWRSGNRLKTVRSKYSHQIFYEVAKIPPLDLLKLEEIMNHG